MSFRQFGAASLYMGDAMDVMHRLISVDHVMTDPPYEEEAHAAGRRVTSRKANRGSKAREVIVEPLDFPPMTPELRTAAAQEMVRLSSGWVLAFCQIEAVALWREEMVGAGASWRRGMVWVKPDGAPQLSGDRPAQGCECIAAAWAGGGRSTWHGGGRSGVIVCNKSDPGMGHGGPRNPHPTQKPERLMRQLIELFTDPGDVILDPFMGSGTTGVAAIELGRGFVGIEQRPDYFELACRRIGAAKEQTRLPFGDAA